MAIRVQFGRRTLPIGLPSLEQVTQFMAKAAEIEAAATPTGLRVVDGVLFIDMSDGTHLQAALPAGGTNPPAQVAPAFTTRPSLVGSTALGGTITVDLGAASGTPAPAITGTLTRPGRAAAAVQDGATFTVEASDQGGTVQVSATATNAAGSVQDSASLEVPAASGPTVQNVQDGGYIGTTTSIDADGYVNVTTSSTSLTGDLGVNHWLIQLDGMLGKNLKARRSTAGFSNGDMSLAAWQMAWSYDLNGDQWHAMDTQVIDNGFIVGEVVAPMAEDRVYLARRPVYSNARWDASIARWKASPQTSPTVSGNADFVVGTLPANTHAPEMAMYGFKFGTGADAFVLTGTIHTDESLGAWAMEGLVDWLLGADQQAVWLRDHLTFYVYPKLNPQARYAGASRVEVSTGTNANRIWATTGFDNIPLSKAMRDVWTRDLPTTVAGNFDCHDTVNGPGRGQVLTNNKPDFAAILQNVYGARTGQTVEELLTTATDSIGSYMRAAHASELSVTIEHRPSRMVGLAEWRLWGADFGKALQTYLYEMKAINYGPWQAPEWVAAPNVSITPDAGNGWTVTGSNAAPKAAFLIPEGKTIQVTFAGDCSGATWPADGAYVRQGSDPAIPASTSTNIGPVMPRGAFATTQTVTHDPARPYVGIIGGYTKGSTRVMTLTSDCRWREVLP